VCIIYHIIHISKSIGKVFFNGKKKYQLVKHGGSYPGINKNDIENLHITVPPIKDQLKLVAEIEKLEQTIKTEQTKIDSAADKKKNNEKIFITKRTDTTIQMDNYGSRSNKGIKSDFINIGKITTTANSCHSKACVRLKLY